MLLPNKWPGSRKRKIVGPRQISMTLSRKYTKMSLATIGKHHGNRDHATVLHAYITVCNLLDVNDNDMIINYNKSLELIREWNSHRTDTVKTFTCKELINRKKLINKELISINEQLNKILMLHIDNKSMLIKTWIKNHVPLEIRQYKLEDYKKRKYENKRSVDN
jgi:hypothetical protein